jgi:uncharacterized protein (TIGR02145 family)
MVITIQSAFNYTLASNATNNTICSGTAVTLSVNIPGASSITDIDGNTYETVQIGTQIWMKENLRTTKYSDGTAIPLVTDNAVWASNYNNGTTLPMMCWYNNDQATYAANKFGALYNWYAVSPNTNGNKNLCPTGWHVPTDAEWNNLIAYLDPSYSSNVTGTQSTTAGGKMKSTSTLYWNNPNSDASNSSGFMGFPGGYRFGNSQFYDVGNNGDWWSSSENNTNNAWFRNLNYNYGHIRRYDYDKTFGFSVRCIKD